MCWVNDMKKLRIGIIGAGQIVEASHLPSYSRHLDKIEIAAICDLNTDRVRYMAEKYKIQGVFQSHKEMLGNAQLDAVSVCVTNKYHCPVTLDALNAGCHVLCEKPPAMSYEEALQMYEAAEKNKKILTFNFHFRHSNEVKAIKAMIDRGELGNIYAARVQALRRRGIPGWGTFTNKELQGGGPLIDIGIHMLDTALYLMGYPEPDYVTACTHQRIGTRSGIGLMGSWDHTRFTVEDSAFGFIRFKNGTSLNLETSFALNMRENKLTNVHLFGDKAGASIFPVQIYSENGNSLTDMELPFLPEADKHYESISDFVMSCIEEKTPVSRASEGLAIQKIIDAMYMSSDRGQPIIF
jgi:predicted dehydrogenase